MSSLLIKRPAVITLNDAQEVLRDTSIVIEGGKIAALVGPTEPLPPADRVLEGAGRVALPGFVNAHTHAAMTLLRGFADDMELFSWLQEKIWPTEARLRAEDVYWGTKLAIAEMIRAGVTCFNDMYFFFEEAAKACEESGIRASISGVLLGILPTAEHDLKRAVEFATQPRAQEPQRVVHTLGPHAPYTCPEPMLRQVIAAAHEHGIGLHIHLSETQTEVADSVKEHGAPPIEQMARLGMFGGPPVTAVHCVWPTTEEMEILAEHRVGVAHCPGSNMKLASGAAPAAAMLAAGVPVGLGSDGAASNNNLDILEEARLAALLAKHDASDPTVLQAYAALYMATRGGAEALGLGDEVGQITVGRQADIILLDMQQPHLQPEHDPVSHLIYAARAGDVCTVVVAGEPLLVEGELQTLDEAEIIARAQECAARLVS